MAAIWLGMMIVSGINKKHFIFSSLAVVVLSISVWFFLAPYQKERVINVFQPRDPQGSGYNVAQATVAIGSGGLIGKGIGHGSQSQLNFIPEKHTDFRFAVIAEEMGLIGSFFILTLYAVIFYRIKKLPSGHLITSVIY